MGTNNQLSYWFTTTKSGKKIAYYWSPKAFRAIRVSLLVAELAVAEGRGVDIGHHPLKSA